MGMDIVHFWGWGKGMGFLLEGGFLSGVGEGEAFASSMSRFSALQAKVIFEASALSHWFLKWMDFLYHALMVVGTVSME